MKGILEKIVFYAKLSPTYNEKAVSFFVQNNTIGIQLDQTLGPEKEYINYISVGSVLENVIIAANYYGFKEKVELNLDKEKTWISVVLAPTQDASPITETLFNQIETLKPNAGAYADEAIPAEYLAQLILASKESDVLLKLFAGPDAVANMAPLIKDVAIEESTMQVQNETSWFEKLLLPIDNLAVAQELDCDTLLTNAAALILLTALKNEKSNWINLGRTYQRMILTAASQGIDYTPIYLAASLSEDTALKWELGYTSEAPLLLVRLGYGQDKAIVKGSNASVAVLDVY